MSDLQGKLQSLATKLGLNHETPLPTVAPAGEVEVAWGEGQSGAEVDWSGYEIPAEQVRLYQKARFHNGEWLFPYVHYTSLNATVGKIPADLERMVNEDDWKIVTIQPNGAGMQSVLLTRTTVHPLTFPVKVQPLEVTLDDVPDNSAAWVEKGSE